MSIYAISDLHLSFSENVDKPMDKYGPRWHNHAQRLKENWCKQIKNEDTVILAGDISWGMTFEDAKPDLDWIDKLPGRKVLIKGNHDYWWTSRNKLNAQYDNMTFLQNTFYYAEGIYICGSRGWLTPDNDEYSEVDDKIYKREDLRFRTSLKAATKKKKNQEMITSSKEQEIANDNKNQILAVLHYPPASKITSFTAFQTALEDFGVGNIIYGHLHGEDAFRKAIKGNHYGVNYQLVSVDYLNCKPICLKF